MGFVLAVALAIGAEETTRYYLAREWPLGIVRVVTLTALSLLLMVAVRIQLGGSMALWNIPWWREAGSDIPALVGSLVMGMLVLWRGIALGRGMLTFDDLYQRFLVGLTAFVVLLLLWGINSGSGEFQHVLASVGMFVAAFFFISLMGLVMVNLRSSQPDVLPRDLVGSLFSRSWLTLYLGVVVAIVGVSVVVAIALSLDLISLLLRPISWMADLLFLFFYYVVGYPVALLASGAYYVVRYLLSLIGYATRPVPDLIAISDFRQAIEGEGPGIPPEAILAVKWVLVVLVVLAVVFFLSCMLFRRRKSDEDEVEAIQESLWSWDGFKGDLRSFLARLLWMFSRRKTATPQAVIPPAAMVQEAGQERLFTVREIYQGLLWEGRGMGFARQPSKTPYEYEGQLKGHIDSGAFELQAITDAYVAERYGALTTPAEQLGLLNRWWRQLRSAFHSQGEDEQAPGNRRDTNGKRD
jgi:hypothetical protein